MLGPAGLKSSEEKELEVFGHSFTDVCVCIIVVSGVF